MVRQFRFYQHQMQPNILLLSQHTKRKVLSGPLVKFIIKSLSFVFGEMGGEAAHFPKNKTRGFSEKTT